MNLATLLGKVREYNPAADIATVQRAYEFSADVHRGQKRKSGEPYLVHPLEVAALIADLRLDVPSVVTGLLHDTVEDTLDDARAGRVALRQRDRHAGRRRHQDRPDQLHEPRGDAGRELPQDDPRDGARHPRHPRQARRPHPQHADARAPRAGAPDRDRPGDARHLRAARAPARHLLDQERARGQRAPLPAPGGLLPAEAQRREEEDRARGVHRATSSRRAHEEARGGRPRGRRSPAGRSTSTRSTRRCRRRTCSTTRSTTWSRSACSSTRSASATRRSASCTRTGSRCRAASRTTSRMPKANMYQSLHTTVIGPYGERIEVQIRTHEMHRVAEAGIAAHWRYKGQSQSGSTQEIERFAWLRQLLRVAAAPRGSAGVPALGEGGPLRPRRSSCSRRRATSSTSRRAPPSSTSRTACTPRSASTAPARASTASSCRSATSCRAATPSRSSPPRARRRARTG